MGLIMTTGVLMGPELANLAASNFAYLRPMLVPIQGRSFMMGAGTPAAHRATITSFRMGRTPVTNEEYGRFASSLGRNRFALFVDDPKTSTLGVIAIGPSREAVRSSVMNNPGAMIVVGGTGVLGSIARGRLDTFADSLGVAHIGDHDPPARFDAPRQPAVKVNWYQALVYASLHGGTLPTEWQWELAARAVWGSEELREFATPSGRLTHEEAHFGSEVTVEVDGAGFKSLRGGLRHMVGNVGHWTRSWHGDYPLGSVVDPIGPLEGTDRSVRGGASYFKSPDLLRATSRNRAHPILRVNSIGFRVVAPPRN